MYFLKVHGEMKDLKEGEGERGAKGDKGETGQSDQQGDRDWEWTTLTPSILNSQGER